MHDVWPEWAQVNVGACGLPRAIHVACAARGSRITAGTAALSSQPTCKVTSSRTEHGRQIQEQVAAVAKAGRGNRRAWRSLHCVLPGFATRQCVGLHVVDAECLRAARGALRGWRMDTWCDGKGGAADGGAWRGWSI